MKKIFFQLLLWILVAGCAPQKFAQTGIDKNEVLHIIEKVNDYWQQTHPQPGWAFWDEAAYYTGNMEAYYTTKNEAYKKYAEAWAEKNKWMGAKSADKTKWKYSYGETDDYVLFGDWQIAFQTYIDLYNLNTVKDPKKLPARLR